jgi:electron transfer flavoprotein alpha subunit
MVNPELGHYNSDAYTKLISEFAKEKGPSVILATASQNFKDVMPRVAARLSSGLASDCIDLKVENGKLSATRPVFAGKSLVKVTMNGNPQMALSRPNVYQAVEKTPGARAEAVTVNADCGQMRVKVKEVRKAEADMVDLAEADRIISGGRAMGNSDNFRMLQELAKVLRASVGASRAAVDAGYISHDHQVGQTGRTVNPTLYVACGISGAIQHLAGMRTSKVIVAINKDADAPIFTKADFGIVGDLFKIIPVLTEKIKKLTQE